MTDKRELSDEELAGEGIERTKPKKPDKPRPVPLEDPVPPPPPPPPPQNPGPIG